MRADVVLGYINDAPKNGFINVQGMGAQFSQKSGLVVGAPAGASLVSLRYKRSIITLGPGGYLSALPGE